MIICRGRGYGPWNTVYVVRGDLVAVRGRFVCRKRQVFTVGGEYVLSEAIMCHRGGYVP